MIENQHECAEDEPIKKTTFIHRLFNDTTKEGISTFVRMVQTAAIGLVCVFLLRFIGSVDKLTDSLDVIKVELTKYQVKSSLQLDYIKEKVNENDVRLDDLTIDHNKLKTQFEIHKITGK